MSSSDYTTLRKLRNASNASAYTTCNTSGSSSQIPNINTPENTISYQTAGYNTIGKTGPMGPQGDIGPTGHTGSTGPQGIILLEVASNNCLVLLDY